MRTTAARLQLADESEFRQKLPPKWQLHETESSGEHPLPIFTKSKHPFYIVAPPYTRTSAGIRCLHLLCHCLNRRGQNAYLLPDPTAARLGLKPVTGVDLLTPLLSETTAKIHFDEGRVPIVVYPESMMGNPYEAACVVRYVAHFPGFLGGDKRFDDDELCYGFSQRLATAAGVPNNVLFIPSVDTSVYQPPQPGVVRRGSCFYADKYRKVHGGVPMALTDNSIEIKRQEPGEQSQAEIVRLLQTSEVFYTYENTALAIEAVLCGCAAVFIPNPWLAEVISDQELGREGYAWGASAEQIAWAKSTVEQGARNYHSRVERFWLELDEFVDKCRDHASRFRYDRPIVPARTDVAASHHLLLGVARSLPPRAAREFAKSLSTCGFRKAGAVVWDDTVDRTAV